MKNTIFIIACLFPLISHSAESYICIPDMATGFKFKRESGWNVALFKPDDKFLVTRANEEDKKKYKNPTLSWVIKKLGSAEIHGNPPIFSSRQKWS